MSSWDSIMRSSGILAWFALPLLGCLSAVDLDGVGAPTSEAANNVVHDDVPVATAKASLACVHDGEDELDGLPHHLECTGLYSDLKKKTLAAGVEPYQPGLTLWSDGADKHRWIYLPKGTKIDASSPGDWKFPVGTKFFKEFAANGHRIETRLFQKDSDRWVRTTYRWNSDESDALRTDGTGVDLPEVQLGGKTYHIPSNKECDECHQGRTDRALGYEEIAMGYDAGDGTGASGLTLAMLAQKGLISPAPEQLSMQILDDGTGLAVPALRWMHMNCGVSCHNDNPNAAGHSTKLRMKLDAAQLAAGVQASEYDVVSTTVGVPATTPQWGGKIRIVPGSPEMSLLYQLASTRGASGENSQMPPIASQVVDEPALQAIADWISALPAE